MRLIGQREQSISPAAVKQRERCPRERDDNGGHSQGSKKPASASLALVPTDLQRIADRLQDEPSRQIGDAELAEHPVAASVPVDPGSGAVHGVQHGQFSGRQQQPLGEQNPARYVESQSDKEKVAQG